MSEIVYLNGQFMPKEDAKISPDDRGFIFADGVYEVVKFYQGRAFRYDDHISRLKHSLAAIKLVFDVTVLEKILHKLLELNNLNDKQAGVYWQITRGANKRVHHFPENITPTIYAFAFPFESAIEKLENGIKVITHEDIRWLRCDIKSVSLLPNTMLYNKAVENGAGECLLIRNGLITEATHSSVLGVKDGKVVTHPQNNLVLPGITRKVIHEICVQRGIPFVEKAFSYEELLELDELMIAGTGSEITPVVEVDGKLIGNGKPGSVVRILQDDFFKTI
jgi:D-alanine transaminase